MTEKIFHDRKEFFLDLKENNRGRVLKITEKVGGRRDTIMVPMEVLHDLYEALGRIMDYERGLDGPVAEDRSSDGQGYSPD